MTDSVWKQRFERLREAGLDHRQAQAVFELLDTTSAFGSQKMSGIAWGKLEEVYPEIQEEEDRAQIDAIQQQEIRAETFAAEALLGMSPGTTEGWHDEPDLGDDRDLDREDDDEAMS